MAENLNQLRAGDVVLEELEGVKRRLTSDSVEQKIAALLEVFIKYDQAGLDLVIQILKDESSPIQPVAYLLLKERAEQQAKEAVQEYYRERKKLYECSQEFLINYCHQLRTPLGGIIGHLRLILDGLVENPEEEREFLEFALCAAFELLDLLNDFIDIVKIEAG